MTIEQQIHDQLQLWLDSFILYDAENPLECLTVSINRLLGYIQDGKMQSTTIYLSDNAVTFYVLFGNRPMEVLRNAVNSFKGIL